VGLWRGTWTLKHETNDETQGNDLLIYVRNGSLYAIELSLPGNQKTWDQLTLPEITPDGLRFFQGVECINFTDLKLEADMLKGDVYNTGGVCTPNHEESKKSWHVTLTRMAVN
jgi:hypothetical protein